MKLTSARAPWDRYASGFAADLRQCSDWGSRRSVGWGTRERRDWRFGWLGSKPAHFGVHRVPDVEVKPWFQPFSTVKWPLTLNQFIEKGLVWKWNTPQSGHFMPFPQKSDNQWIWGFSLLHFQVPNPMWHCWWVIPALLSHDYPHDKGCFDLPFWIFNLFHT